MSCRSGITRLARCFCLLAPAALAAGCVARPALSSAPVPAVAWKPGVAWNGHMGQAYFLDCADFSKPDLYRPTDGVWVPPPTSMVARLPWPGLYRIRTRSIR